MPEALLTIPPLQISADHSSENENSSASAAGTSDRSSSDQNSSRPPTPYKNIRSSNGTQGKNKSRKSSNAKRLSKKATLCVNSSQQKKLGTKSQIPRSLILTPSSSSASLTTNGSFRTSPLTSVNGTITREEQTITTVLQRQKTGVILAYRQRKSISQMDMKHFRRNVQFPVRDSNHSGKSLMDRSHYEQQLSYSFSHNNASCLHKMDNYDMSEWESRLAGMKIFATIMLNAWRKRRNEVKRLMEEIVELKRASIKGKNQLHVINTLFRVEQKRNDELNCQLKQSVDDLNATKSSCESLTTSLISLKADNALLEQQIIIKDQDLDTINALLSQAKSDLFKHMAAQRELQANLSMEQRKIQTLENQKNDLINEIYEVSKEAKDAVEQLRTEMQSKIEELDTAQKELHNLEQQVVYLNECREQELCETKVNDENMKVEIEMLENEVIYLKRCLEQTLANRIKNCCYHSLTYPKVAFQMLHWFAFYLLPATPPPKPHTFPFGLTLDKVLSIVKR